MPQSSLATGLTEERGEDPLKWLSMSDGPTCVAGDAAVASYVHNADVSWNTFSPDAYWQHNYCRVLPEDREIIGLVSDFLGRAFTDRPPAQRAIDVGSGTNLYPALLMLPWTEQILLTDYSESNVRWLHKQLDDDSDEWSWQSFWDELQEAAGYQRISAPREKLRKACVDEPGYAGIEPRSVFDLPRAQWDLGTMFFVAESITQDPGEFRRAVERFTGALTPDAPFAAAFMAGSKGYEVGNVEFPALWITADDVRQHLTDLGASRLSVELLEAGPLVRDGYEGMIVATGFARGR